MEKLIRSFFGVRIKRENNEEDKKFLAYLEEDVVMTPEEQLSSLKKLKEIVVKEMAFKDVIRWRVLLKFTEVSIEFLEREMYEKANNKKREEALG